MSDEIDDPTVVDGGMPAAAPKKTKGKAAKPPVAQEEEFVGPPEPEQKKKVQKAVIFIDADGSKKNFVTASRNGRSYQIRTGEEVTVPMVVVDILNNAKSDRMVQIDGQRRFMPYHRIPFKVLRFVEE